MCYIENPIQSQSPHKRSRCEGMSFLFHRRSLLSSESQKSSPLCMCMHGRLRSRILEFWSKISLQIFSRISGKIALKHGLACFHFVFWRQAKNRSACFLSLFWRRAKSRLSWSYFVFWRHYKLCWLAPSSFSGLVPGIDYLAPTSFSRVAPKSRLA